MERNSIRGIGSRNLDLALTRRFRIGHLRDIEFRAETFNALNWTQWGQPGTNFNQTAVFGQITGTAPGALGEPRILQFAVKYLF
jgi:hypothetical protein